MARWSWRGIPEARNDGSGKVAVEIWAIDDNGAQIPARHQTILLDADGIQQAKAAPTKAQQVAAMKALIAAELEDATWGNDALEAVLAQNAESVAAVEAFEDWRENELGIDYPISFTLTI